MRDLSEREFIEQILNRSGRPLPETAYQPLARLIEQARSANEQTARVYLTAFGLFFQYLETRHSDRLPPILKDSWCPFAVAEAGMRRTTWAFRPPAAVLHWVDTADLDGFMAWRAAEGDSRNTILARIAAVKSLFRAAYEASVIDERQAVELDVRIHQRRQGPILPEPQQEPTGRWLTTTEVRRLRGVVETSTLKGKRDLALLDCILYLGLRADELRSLIWSCFEMTGDSWLTLELGQSLKHRRLQVHPMLRLSLIAWFSAMPFWQEPDLTPLFLNIYKNGTTGRRVITTIAIEQTVTRYGGLAGIALPRGTDRLTPTILRRTCGHHAIANGASLRQVQELLGLSSLDLTANFIGAFDGDVETAVDYIRYDR